MSRHRWKDETTDGRELRAARLLADGDPGVLISALGPLGQRPPRRAPGRLRTGVVAVAVLSFSATLASAASFAAWRLWPGKEPAPVTRPVASPPPQGNEGLAQEVETLRRALESLSRNDPEQSLQILASYEGRSVQLEVDRRVVQARALMMLSRYDGALAVFNALSEDRLTPGLILLWADALQRKNQCVQAQTMLDRLEGQPLSGEERDAQKRLRARCAAGRP
ncbi:MAG: hypothetical protein ACOZIN_04435 [Myxococcota bacterium]